LQSVGHSIRFIMGDVEHGVDDTPSRVCFTVEELTNFNNEQFVQQWTKQEQYVNYIETQLSTVQSAPSAQIRELEEKLRQSLSESARRESILVMRLNSKEQEMQDLIVQIQELKASQAANAVSLRSSLLDPAVNLLIQQLRKELEKAKSALEETQNELSAWKFTPDSNTGKRLMAKCRLLYQENEELGRMISSGRLAKLEGDLALQRNFSEEMKKSQSELDEFLLELDEDVEGMQSTIYFLQQQLRQTREQLAAVQKENEVFRSSSSSLTQCQLAGESSHTTQLERSEPYMQTNGILDHSIHQNEFSSPEQLDPSTAAPAAESGVKQPTKRNAVTSQQSSDRGGTPHCESEPDSNHFEHRTDDVNDVNDAGAESDTDEDVPVEKESVAEADTTDNNDMRRRTEEEEEEEESEEVEAAGNVVVCQAVADEGLILVDAVARTNNCGSVGGSPDDGGGSNRDLVYNRADCGVAAVAPSAVAAAAAAAASSHRSSTDGVGDLVSGSGCVDDENESSFRTTNSSLVNGDSEAAVKEEDNNLSDKCQPRKRTASQADVDDDDDAADATASLQSSTACRPSGSQDNSQAATDDDADADDAVSVSLPKRSRSDAVANGNDDIDDHRE